MFAIHRLKSSLTAIRIRSQLLLTKTKFIRFLKKSTFSAPLLLLAKQLKMPLLAGEKVTGDPIGIESFARKGHKKHLIVVFPNIFWNFRWQRPQQIFSRSATDGYSVLFVSLRTTAIKTELQDMYGAKDNCRIMQNAVNIADIRLPSVKERFILNDRLTTSDRNNMVMALTAVIYEIAEHWKQNTPEVTFVVEHPLWQPVVELLRGKIAGKVIFDLMDNHRGFDQITSSATKMELKLLKMADTTIVSSSFLKKYALTRTKHVEIIRNATDYKHFFHILPNGELDSLKTRPIIGYFGALNEWFDMELVSEVARANTQWNIVLIGSVSPCNFASVEKLKNVFFLGEKPYLLLPGYMSYFDVCIIPFKLNPLTAATNPVKFYEYLSMGKQIVSTPLPELFPYTQYCQLADNANDFAKAIQQALQINKSKLGNSTRIRHQKLAKRNTWEKRWLKLKKLL